MWLVSVCTALRPRLLIPEDFNAALERSKTHALDDARDPLKPAQSLKLRLVSHSLFTHAHTGTVWLTTVWRVKILRK